MDPSQTYSDLQPFVQKEAQDIADATFKKSTDDAQYDLAYIPSHVHNGVDSNQISEVNIAQRVRYIHTTIQGASASVQGNYGPFWIAPFACTVISIMEAHSVASTGVGSPTLLLYKVPNGVITGSGIQLLVTPIPLDSTRNTIQTSALKNTSTTTGTSSVRDVTLIAGDRLAILGSGDLTSPNNVVVVVGIQY